ncbi:hypothetical protein GOBAR_DD34262 [Gossypium barbadense]|nr:hypothetical protein GOBAR_DD34262 [Gossypium barbadense]
MDDEKPTKGNEESKRSKRKNKLTGTEERKNSQGQLIVKRGADDINGLPGDEVQLVKEESQDSEKVMPVGKEQDHLHSDRALGSEPDIVPVSQSGDKDTSTLKSEEKQTAGKSSQVRTFPNGLVVQELAMGKPDGKRASRGKQGMDRRLPEKRMELVSVHYIGKLQKNGKIFDSNVGRAPFKFRLGVGEVIKGWDVGVEGMRVGDKRKLVIPPAMGYGSKGAGGRIPPNAWLEFDVELVGVR